jgi:hypothetical protein
MKLQRLVRMALCGHEEEERAMEQGQMFWLVF